MNNAFLDVPQSTSHALPSEHPNGSSDSASSACQTAPHILPLPTSAASLSSALPAPLPCHGYLLETPKDQPPLMFYPIALETIHHISWSLSLHGGKLYLRSKTCTAFRAAVNQASCLSCKLLHNDSLVMGIRHRITDGVAEKTKWVYFAPVHMLRALERKNRQIDHLKLQGLNTSRKLLLCAREMEGWKRVVLAISTSDTPRIHVALTVALNRGSGFRGVLDMLDRASRHVTSGSNCCNTILKEIYEIAERFVGLCNILLSISESW